METPGQEGSGIKRSLRKKAGLRNYDENLMDKIDSLIWVVLLRKGIERERIWKKRLKLRQ